MKESRTLTQEQYEAQFDLCAKHESVKQILDIRKFEIDLYWKRAGYFWTFNSLAFSAYGAVYLKLAEKNYDPALSDVLVCISGAGAIVAFAWFLVNKGSKYWQENWENHLDLLENNILGPLYKTVLETRPERGVSAIIVGPGGFSVSKINQAISFFAIIAWIFLLLVALKLPPVDIGVWWRYMFVAFVGGACFLLHRCCRTGKGGEKKIMAVPRETLIE